jgi:drug/metabolite transporter (DMT)-like permease
MILPRHFFDQAAIALSAVCIVHCLAVPVLIAVLPIAALSFGDATHFHALMLWLVVPTSVAGFGLGFRVHRRLGLVLLGAAGVAVLVAAALWGHSVWRESFEIGVSVVGSLILAAAHWLNFREVRRVHHHG